MRRRCLILGTACACLAVGVNAGLEDYESYPKRSDADAAVIEWGHSAMIQSVDGVVASFGAQISETEAALFEVEASVVMSQPPQACGKGGLKNAAKLHGQIALVMRGGCNFLTKANLAVKAGAAALVVINNDAASPDHAFAMDGNDAPQSDVVVDIPCVMVSYNGGQALLTDDPPRVRLYAGAGRPFIETVSDASPVLYLVHNLLTPEECDRLVALAGPQLRPSRPMSKGADPAQPVATRKSNSTLLVLGAWKDSVLEALDQKVSSVIGYPTSYFADLEVNHYSVGGLYAPHYDWSPSMYQEHVMTLLLCLDDVPVGAGGEAVFPYASPPVKVRARARGGHARRVTSSSLGPHISYALDGQQVQPRKGLAIVLHNVGDDGEPCPHSINGVAPLLEGESWTAHQWIFATPMPFARRVVLPTMLLPFGGDPPAMILRAMDRAELAFGGDTGYLIVNWCLIAGFALVALAIASPALFVAWRMRRAAQRQRAASKKK